MSEMKVLPFLEQELGQELNEDELTPPRALSEPFDQEP